ncbi:MAG: sugar phosphate isomerase/epimerase family protein [Planctomycetota bacterium]
MFRSAITVSLVAEAKGGPFVYWAGLEDAFENASKLGFHAIEIFAPGPDTVPVGEVRTLMDAHGLDVAAVGTGAGMVKHGLSLTHAESDIREQARDFIRSMIDFGAELGAPAIIGSMQGRHGGDVSQDQAMQWLAEALQSLGQHAQSRGQFLIYEPLNRYETNLITKLADGAAFLKQHSLTSIKLLADLFHMNIEEANLAEAFREAAGFVGHIHFVDSNRQAAGMGHMVYEPLIEALRETNYEGYLCAEAFPLPDSAGAAEATIAAFQKYAGT